MIVDRTPDTSRSFVLDKQTVVAFLDPQDSLHRPACDLIGDFWYDGHRMVLPATVLMDLHADIGTDLDMATAFTAFTVACVDEVHPITARIAIDAADYATHSPDLPLACAVPLVVARELGAWCVVTTNRDWSGSGVRVAVVGIDTGERHAWTD